MRRRIWLLLVPMVASVVACGRLGEGATTGSTGGIPHPMGADELVLRVELTGGFVPVEVAMSALPSWSLFGDGSLIVQGPQIEIYPPPALPSLVRSRISEEGVQAILEAARDAGLMDGDAAYGNDCVADAATTVFTTNAGGSTSVVEAYALELDDPSGGCETQPRAREKLRDVQADLGDLGRWLPEGSVGPEEPYEPTQLEVLVLPYQGEPELPQTPIAWPLEEPLASFGEPGASGPTDVRCGVVSGQDLATLLPLARSANQLTPWESDGEAYRLVFRPLLPDEHAC